MKKLLFLFLLGTPALGQVYPGPQALPVPPHYEPFGHMSVHKCDAQGICREEEAPLMSLVIIDRTGVKVTAGGYTLTECAALTPQIKNVRVAYCIPGNLLQESSK